MKQIKYKISFFSDWHCGSGLAAGADADALVVKDENELPFIPGKTIKGLVREAVEEIAGFSNDLQSMEDVIVDAFGYFDEENGVNRKGSLCFTNAELSCDEAQTILDKGLKEYLFHSISSTAIGDDGVAKAHSLRKIEVTVPCNLYGEIKNIPDELYGEIGKALFFIKRLGKKRNRGLGRCSIVIINEGGDR